MESEKPKYDIVCRGRIPETGKPCQTVLYQSDGEFLYINNLILNDDLVLQYITCSNCGYRMTWRRREEFINNGGGGRQNLNNRTRRQKFQSRFK